jgi:hypothetical protein
MGRYTTQQPRQRGAFGIPGSLLLTHRPRVFAPAVKHLVEESKKNEQDDAVDSRS